MFCCLLKISSGGQAESIVVHLSESDLLFVSHLQSESRAMKPEKTCRCCLFWLFSVFLFTFVQGFEQLKTNDSKYKPQETEILDDFQQEMQTENVIDTTERQNGITVDVDFNQLQNENIVGQKLERIADVTERLLQFMEMKFPHGCSLARSARLKLLSNGKKYLFQHTTLVRWEKANDLCTEKGLHLATFSDQTDADVVAAEGFQLVSGDVWWVSAINQGSADQVDFRWHDGSELKMDSPLWQNNRLASRLNCVFAQKYNDRGKLFTYLCTNDRYFVCELPAECY